MKNTIEKIFAYYKDIRQQIHANPELAFEEFHTAELVKQELEKMGLPVQTQVGKTGVVAVLDSGKPGKTLAFRADMDALPIAEETDVPYRSKNPGKMHACGHDGHTAALLATARVLCEHKAELQGKIKFIFQPAEEGGRGAKAMIADGVLDNPQVDAIFAFHNHPGAPLGSVLARAGCALYGMSDWNIEVTGKGGHAAQPETVVNPIPVAAHIISQIEIYKRALSQESPPTIITTTQLHSGTTRNVVPNTAVMEGTLRIASLEKFDAIQAHLQGILQSIAAATQTQIHLNLEQKCPPTISTVPETEFALNLAKKLFGDEQAQIKPHPARASEDFAYYLQQIPGTYLFIGNGNSAFCHNSHYDFNDAVLRTATELFCAIALQYSNKFRLVER